MGWWKHLDEPQFIRTAGLALPSAAQAATGDDGHVTATSVLAEKAGQKPAVTETKAAQQIEAAAKAIKEGMDLYEPLKSLQQEYMVRYEKLSDGVQIATYENGTRVVGNMSDRTQSFEGKTLPPFGWTIL